MQNRYVADIGDFGKFQLFRYLFLNTTDSLAQIWFLHPDEKHNNDGKYINYFERIKGSDIILEALMQEIIQSNKRQVRTLEKMGVLHNARYFYPPIPTPYHDRAIWIKKALHFTKQSNIIAVAPDNGIALKCKRSDKTFSFISLNETKHSAHKYIFLEEIASFYAQPQIDIMILYQHLGRCFSHERQITLLKEMLEKEFGYILAIKHTPYSPRVFFFLLKDRAYYNSLKKKLESFSAQHHAFWKLS